LASGITFGTGKNSEKLSFYSCFSLLSSEYIFYHITAIYDIINLMKQKGYKEG
jgi:hypothetical protein